MPGTGPASGETTTASPGCGPFGDGSSSDNRFRSLTVAGELGVALDYQLDDAIGLRLSTTLLNAGRSFGLN